MLIDEIIFNENKQKLKITYEEYSKLSSSEKVSKLDESNCSYSFIYSLPNLTKAYLTFVSNIVEDKSDAVYLLLCVLSISLGYKKGTYDNLFTELRMRDIYSLAKDLEDLNNNLFTLSSSKNLSEFIKSEKFIGYLGKISSYNLDDLIEVLPKGEVEENIKSGKLTTKYVLNTLLGKEKTSEIFSKNNVKKVMKWGQWKELPDNVEILNDNHK